MSIITQFISRRKDKIIDNQMTLENKWNGVLVKHKASGKTFSIIYIPLGQTLSNMIKKGKYNPEINISYQTYELCRQAYEIIEQSGL